MTEPKETTVTLISWTQNPLETIYCEWQASRTNGPVPSPSGVRGEIAAERFGVTEGLATSGEYEDSDISPGPFEREVRKVAEDCINMRVPIAETIDFVFLIDNAPIALREQMVRHRVGHKFGSRLGADLIPDISDSSWWAQTMRAMDMSSFATNGDYFEPEWVRQRADDPMPGFHTRPSGDADAKCNKSVGNITLREFYRDQFLWIQAAYRRLVKAGMPQEDARNILPLGTNQRITWKMNLSALIHVLSKRGCWIAQLGMWEPVIRGLVEEVATKIDPMFRNLINPPCIGSDDKFAGCKFHKENKEYIAGRDPHFPCPLWLRNHQPEVEEAVKEAENPAFKLNLLPKGVVTVEMIRPLVTQTVEGDIAEFHSRVDKYEKLWGRNPHTGERE